MGVISVWEGSALSCKEEFIEIFRENIHRDGADKLLDYLEKKSDFFTAPASASAHCCHEGGLCEHSLNVYHSLLDFLSGDKAQELYGLEYSPETIAVVGLLHDVCCTGCFKKQPQGGYAFNDPLPYGHGEKSVYIINGFIRLTREEAMAIRWHMGFDGTEDRALVVQAFKKYRLSFALAMACMEATYLADDEL